MKLPEAIVEALGFSFFSLKHPCRSLSKPSSLDAEELNAVWIRLLLEENEKSYIDTLFTFYLLTTASTPIRKKLKTVKNLSLL